MIELRYLQRADKSLLLQQRTKTKWLDGTTTKNGCYGWADWEDVPIAPLDPTQPTEELESACYVAMPKELTAENGAKALMMGEFYETVETGNEAFCGCGTCDFCIECPGEPESTLQKIPISWTTIKEIYAMAVKHFDAVHTPPTEER